MNEEIKELKETNSSRIFLIEYELIESKKQLKKLNITKDLLDEYDVSFFSAFITGVFLS